MRAKYLGGGHIHGVPARDLTAEEYEQHKATIDQQEQATGQKFYEPVVDKPQRTAAKDGD